jgi:hypothetical protein
MACDPPNRAEEEDKEGREAGTSPPAYGCVHLLQQPAQG